jgi:alcohol-forming fatty acyl-CoA reductase
MSGEREFHLLDRVNVLLTGATGFFGQALLEKLLSAYPTVQIWLLIRGRDGVSAAARMEGLMRKPVFQRWQQGIGDGKWQRVVSERVTVIDGDLDGMTVPGDLDVVIHGASSVSFDAAIDEAFQTNVAGVAALYEALSAAGANPHVVHVSTAYVAGMGRGVVPEKALGHTVDWRAELACARAARAEAERDSRRPEVLRKVTAQAWHEHGKTGPRSVARSAEQAREHWVAQRLIDYGRERARSLGWYDTYTFTKALGERVAEQLWAETGHRLSIVRPAVVESALRHPYPGWLDGFKMIDPLIIAFGMGTLSEYPGPPDGIIDLIPIDMVVNAMLAIAATAPDQGSPAYFQVGSTSRNPLLVRALYEYGREYYQRHPIPTADQGHIRAPLWRFPGDKKVALMLRGSERAAALAERILLQLPGSARTQEWMGTLHRQQSNLEFLRRIYDLYGPYAPHQITYDDSRTYALHQLLPDRLVAEHGFDPAAIDWRHYLQEVHYPAVSALMRARPVRRGGSLSRVHAAELPERTDVAAVFDLEGTVVASNLVESYLWARLPALPRSRWGYELVDLVRKLPRYVAAERGDRGEFVRAFLRRYEGADEAELSGLVDEVLGPALLQRVRPEAIRQIRRHRHAGHRTILVTGAPEVFVRPLAGLFDEVVASRMHAADGVLTGYLEAPPVVDEARAAWLQRYGRSAGLDLTGCYGYGDSYSDRPMLEMVGHPSAVNPDPALYAHARRMRWPIYNWGTYSRKAADALLDTVKVRSS